MRAAFFCIFCTAVFFMSPEISLAQQNITEDRAENILYLQLNDGWVIIEMRPDLAPNHVKRIKELVREGYYKGSTFHRVIKGFIAQTGDPSKINKGTGQRINAEFSTEKHVRGTVSMARYDDINSADDQFFICTAESATNLDNLYTIWGKVIHGMNLIDGIKAGDPTTGMVQNPDPLLNIYIATDLPK